MKNIKIFLSTLIIVIATGGAILAIFGRGDAIASVSSSLVPSANRGAADSSEAVKETITIDNINMSVPYGGNVSGETLAKDVIDEDIDTLAGNEPDYEALYANAVNTKVLKTSEEGKLTISFAGDILFDPGYSIYASYKQRGYDINQCISEDLLQKMHGADIMMVNNEFPYSDAGAPLENKMYTFRAPTAAVSTLDEMGVDIVSIANNHTYDYGEQAFLDTLTTLENAGMPYVGAGRNIEDASRPYYYVVDGKKIAIIAASQIEKTWSPDTKGATETTPGVFRCLDAENLCNAISKAKEECDFVILYVHWGTESTDQLDNLQLSEVTKYVDAGADLIIGDHPHVLQPVGYVKGVPVIFSMANFWFNSKTQDTCFVTLTLNTDDASIDTLKFEPCLQSNMSVSLLHNEEKDRVLNYMRSISHTANIDSEGYITEK